MFKKINKKILIVGALIVLVLATIYVYFISLTNNLVEWDDQFQIINNLLIRRLDLTNLKKIFTGFTLGMYQPLATLSFALEYKFFSARPLFIHLDSLLWHCLNLVLVYILTKKLFRQTSIALISAAFFALHPIQTEAVAWASARSTLLAGAATLATLIAYLNYQKKLQLRSYLLVLLFAIFAFLSKVTAVSILPLLFIFDYYQKRPWKNLKLWLEKLPFLAMSLVSIAFAVNYRLTNAELPPVNYVWWHKLTFIPYSLVSYMQKILAPINLSAYCELPALNNGQLPWTFPCIAIVFLIFAGWLIWQRSNQRLAIFLSTFFAVLILPTIPFNPFAATFSADRYVYLASLAIFWALALVVMKIYDRFERLRWLIAVSIILIFILMGFATRARSYLWRNSETLFTDILKDNPNLAIAHNNLGNAKKLRGDVIGALDSYQAALKLKPTDPFTYNNIGAILAESQGDYQAAINYYNQAIKLNSALPLSFYNRACALAKLGKNNLALLDYEKAVKLSSTDDVYNLIYLKSLAQALSHAKNLNRAEEIYSRLIVSYQTPEAYFERGLIRLKQKNSAAGCQDLREADKLGYMEAKKILIDNCQ